MPGATGALSARETEAALRLRLFLQGILEKGEHGGHSARVVEVSDAPATRRFAAADGIFATASRGAILSV